MHLNDESYMTLFALPAILNNIYCANKYVAPCFIAILNSFAHNDIILHASFIKDYQIFLVSAIK